MSCGVMAWLCPSVKPRNRMFGAPNPGVMPGRLFGFLTCAILVPVEHAVSRP